MWSECNLKGKSLFGAFVCFRKSELRMTKNIDTTSIIMTKKFMF